ncbi:MAG TPA: polymer-forming cytoskeletal protein [Candidatus Acidoferrales bacterium]|nr:polymer-forming cytoskeletal protein [Candidatus Acidoferrales bacterium]
MWFKQNEQKSPQQPEAAVPQQQPAPPAPPVAPVAPTEASQPSARVAPPPAPAPAPASNASRITPGLSVKGEISGREDLWIGGHVDGTLRFDGARIVVGTSGRVHGQIEAREIVIEGTVDGDLRATERLEITRTGNARGDAGAPRIALEEGAIFNGTAEVVRAGESRGGSQQTGAAAARGAQAPRTARPQNTQAAGAAAAAGSPATPATTASSVPQSAPESGNGGASGSSSAGTASAGTASATPGVTSGTTSGATPAATVLLRGIAVDPSEKSE